MDEREFERLVAPHRRELQVHCYRMLGSTHDAEDALQETLLAAWRAIEGFEGRSSLRAWLYRIATNVCLRAIDRRPRRVLTPDYGPPQIDTEDLGALVRDDVWIEPLVQSADEPAERYLERESVELAFIAALQHLPGTQRAVLILRDVLGFSAAETAQLLDTTPVSVNSAMQRAKETIARRMPQRSQQVELAALGDDGVRALVQRFAQAWEAADIGALVALLAADAQFTMPPLPAWFDGRESVARFFRERVFETPWRLRPLLVNGQPGFACYQGGDGTERFVLGAVNVLSIRGGAITRINGFINATRFAGAGIAMELDR
jgi:RNA polymerase sigma-70 factor (ECF subfamily)